MFETLIANLKLVGVLMAMFIGSFGTNVLLGLYQNIGVAKEQFSKERLVEGLIRGAIVLVGCAILTVIISLLPTCVSAIGITVEDGVMEGISVVAMGGVILSMIIRYLKDAITKFYSILYGNKEEE